MYWTPVSYCSRSRSSRIMPVLFRLFSRGGRMGDDRGSSSHCSGRQGLCLSFSGWHADAAGAGAGRAAGALDVVADDAVLGVVREKIGRERGDGRVRGRGEVEPRGRGAAGFDRSVFGIFACS